MDVLLSEREEEKCDYERIYSIWTQLTPRVGSQAALAYLWVTFLPQNNIFHAASLFSQSLYGNSV